MHIDDTHHTCFTARVLTSLYHQISTLSARRHEINTSGQMDLRGDETAKATYSTVERTLGRSLTLMSAQAEDTIKESLLPQMIGVV